MTPYPTYTAAGSQWLDSIPAHWKIGRLDHVAGAWPSNVDKHSVDGELPVRLCNYTDVYKNEAIVDGLSFMVATATPEQIERFRIRVGDTLITKDSETADDIGIPAFVAYEADDLVCGYHLSIIRPDPVEIFPRYLFWALRAQPTLGQWEVLASGVTRVGLRSGDVSKAVLAIPPLDEQRAIADYLDHETARIDTLIEEQQRLIETLQERRQAVCTRAVTLGIDNASLMDSGDPVIGSMPEHWTAKKVGHWLCSLDGRRVPLSAEERAAIQGDFDYYGASGVIDHISEFLFDEPLVLVSEDGANLLARSSPISFAARGRYWVNNHAHVLRPLDGSVEFWAHRLEALDVSPFVSGSAQPKLTASSLMNMRVTAPTDGDEQRRIVAYLDEQTAKIDALIAETETFIELSRERRSALITAAVTGQIDVRGAA